MKTIPWKTAHPRRTNILSTPPPRGEKHFCPLADVFVGSLKSVAVFRRLRELQAEFLVKRLRMYCGASPLRDLWTIDLDSSSTSSRIVFQPRLTINCLLGESKLLFVTILATLFWSFWSWLISVVLQQPHKKQQYRKWGSTIPAEYKVFKEAIGRIFLACFRNPMALDTLPDTALRCSFQSRLLSTWTPRYLVFLTTSNQGRRQLKKSGVDKR